MTTTELLSNGASVATILGGGSVLAAASVWLQGQLAARRARLAQYEARYWSGEIKPGSINTWRVRVEPATDADTDAGRVVLFVVDTDGQPDLTNARSLRMAATDDGFLSREPTQEEYELMKARRARPSPAEAP